MAIGLRMVFLVALLRGSWALAADPIKSDDAVVSDDRSHFSQRFSLGKQLAVVDIRTTAFQKAKHRLKMSESGVQEVDGHRVLGMDGGPADLIKSEVASIEVSWNGGRHKVPRRLFVDCFNTSAVPSRVLLADDFRAVMITLSGGDGAGHYEVTFIVSAEGTVTRFVAETGDF